MKSSYYLQGNLRKDCKFQSSIAPEQLLVLILVETLEQHIAVGLLQYYSSQRPSLFQLNLVIHYWSW
jgi:hypothetical protein